MSKRKLLIVTAALCMVAVLGGGTLAYFTGRDVVDNTFMTATSDDPDDTFSIEVTETAASDTSYEMTGDAKSGYTYSKLLPGDTLHKDPTVTNTGEYDAYVRMTVTVTKGEEWLEALRATDVSVTEKDIISGFDESKWSFVKPDPDSDILWTQNTDGTLTYVLYLKDVLAAKASETLFTELNIPEAFDVEQMQSINGFTINVKAEAIQSKNTGDSPEEAFLLYDEQISQ